MKLFNETKLYLKKYLQIHGTVLKLVIFITLGMLYQCNKVFEKGEVSILDSVSDLEGTIGTSNMGILFFIVIPSFMVLVMKLIDNEELVEKIIKNNSRIRVWNKNVILVFITSILITFIIVVLGYCLSGVILGSFENKWTSDQGNFYKLIKDKENFLMYAKNLGTIKVLSMLFITKLLGLIIIGLLVTILKAIIKSNSLIFIILTIFGMIDGYFVEFSLLYQKLSITITGWVNVISVIINNIYLLIIVVALYFLGREIYSRKDFLN